MLVDTLPAQRPQARATLETIRHMGELPAAARGPAWLQLSLMDKVSAQTVLLKRPGIGHSYAHGQRERATHTHTQRLPT
jgi:hypothetical protein